MTTLFLATVIGWYLVIMSLLLLVREQQMNSVLSDVLSKRALFFIVAIFTFILGLIMVASHNLWSMNWSVVVTLISWLVLISALIRLIWLDTMMRAVSSFVMSPYKTRVLGGVALIIGLFLLCCVYCHPV